MKKREDCLSCKYFRPSDSYKHDLDVELLKGECEIPWMGECHRSEPRIFNPNLEGDIPENREHGVWPVVDPEDWCGQFELRGSLKNISKDTHDAE